MHPALSSSLMAFVVAIASAQTLGGLFVSTPSFVAPFPVPLFMVALLSGPLAVLAAAALFVLWQPRLFVGAIKVPTRSLHLFAVSVICSLVYYALYLEAGPSRYGSVHYFACLALDLVLIVATALAVHRARKQPSHGRALCAQALLFLWLFSFAMPYFGEGP